MFFSFLKMSPLRRLHLRIVTAFTILPKLVFNLVEGNDSTFSFCSASKGPCSVVGNISVGLHCTWHGSGFVIDMQEINFSTI